MLHKTRGIVLRTTPYAESSVVVQVFTEKFGVQSYLVNGVKKAKAKISINVLQPLHLLELVVYQKNSGGLQRMAEARQLPPFQRIPYDIIKSSLVLFLNEMLYKSVKQQGPDDAMFEFVFNAVNWLDSSERTPVNFHLYFLLKFTRYLGFFPAPQELGQHFFDLKDGVFTSYPPNHSLVLHEPHTSQWASILTSRLTTLENVKISNTDRRVLLHKLIDFYRLHIDNVGDIKSCEILEEVLG
ncbi:DNA repair protein RecO [Olivibacter domesticus]|uniref:DNA repair protein RecO n=1 Tax=Olivibacter domesticus TaxID=407022 RepID=A0A1H7ZJN4_OLID1|nr:DNA repair protein RecO [Olivibacter domesticus]SEM58610.1 DNA replication and repair protein RecO [Olivibacter domesticus]SEM61384.1 DNA replication and repair protein RecO [Olivibacter domesticus]